MIRPVNDSGVLHVRFQGRSCDVPLKDLDVGAATDDREVKNRIAEYLSVPQSRFEYYTVDRHQTGNMTVRPEAVFG